MIGDVLKHLAFRWKAMTTEERIIYQRWSDAYNVKRDRNIPGRNVVRTVTDHSCNNALDSNQMGTNPTAENGAAEQLIKDSNKLGTNPTAENEAAEHQIKAATEQLIQDSNQLGTNPTAENEAAEQLIQDSNKVGTNPTAEKGAAELLIQDSNQLESNPTAENGPAEQQLKAVMELLERCELKQIPDTV